MLARSVLSDPVTASGAVTGSVTSPYSSTPSRSWASPVRRGSISVSRPGSASKRCSGTMSVIAPSRAPTSWIWLVVSRRSGIALSGAAPEAMSATVASQVLASVAHSFASRVVSSGIEQLPSLEGPPEGDLVGVLEAPAHGQAGCEAGDADLEGGEQPRGIRGRRLALEVGVGGDDHLGDAAVREAGHQLGEAQVVGPDTVHRGDRPAEDVVPPA